MDITQIILDQHAQQREMFAQLEQWPSSDTEGLAAVWKRLEVLLETHAEAEERYFYPDLLQKGTGVADADEGTVQGEVSDAISDHNEIRDAIKKVRKAKVGTKKWWDAITEANIANGDHMAEEERQDLTDFREHASLQQRHDIAVRFLRYQALKAANGIPPVDKDPDAYVANPKATNAKADAKAPSLKPGKKPAAKKPAAKKPAAKKSSPARKRASAKKSGKKG